MYAGLTQTLEGFKARPLTTRRNLTEAPMDQVVLSLVNAKAAHKDIHEETVLYYLHSHGQHLIEARHGLSDELPDLEARLLSQGYKERSEIAMRMFYYLLVITGEEGAYGTAKHDSLFEYLAEETSEEAAKWIEALCNRKAPNVPNSPTLKLGDATRACQLWFDYASWGSSFGGARWEAISATLVNAVRGKTTLELMVDNAFTLSHNNGAIFNKGHNYSCVDYEPYYTILDVQASGQIPSAIHKGGVIKGVTAQVKKVWEGYAELFPQEFSTPYDPSLVKSMGAVRAQKEAALQKKAQQKNAAQKNSSPVPKGPPQRTSDGIDDMMSSMITGQDFNSLVSSASKKNSMR